MNTKKINPSILLCVSFLSAATGSPLICALCMGAILFLCEDKSLAGQSVEALVLSFVDVLFSQALSVIKVILNLIPSNIVTNVIFDIIALVTNFVSLAVFVIGIIAAAKALKKEKVNIPLISGKFDGIITE